MCGSPRTGKSLSFVRYANVIETLEGQCQCGEVKYRILGKPATLFACRCTDCQRQSSSAFGTALWVRNAAVQLLGGNLPSNRAVQNTRAAGRGAQF
ncbi:GFA family protein [Hydrogenophaga sp. RWCD_12]|uniref:GFA family protein n=1 Tax=Hydrogenophaga sp. RWCD_12 TaxID=3391190 RepID=UPI00398499B9